MTTETNDIAGEAVRPVAVDTANAWNTPAARRASLRRDGREIAYQDATGDWHLAERRQAGDWLAPGRWGQICPTVKTVEKKAKAIVREFVEGRG